VKLTRTHKLIALAAVLLVAGGSAGWYTAAVSQSRAAALIGFDADRAYADCAALCNIGPRTPGAPEDEEGAGYVEGKFKEAGLSNVHTEQHEVTTFQVNSASLSMITVSLRGVDRRDFGHISDFVLYQYSGPTNGAVRYEIVDAGNGTEEAFSGVDAAGKAVLTTQQCLPLAAEKGAAAVIVQNTRLAPELDWPPYSGGLYGSDANGDSIPYPDANPDAVLPTCAVSGAVGDEIRDAINNSRNLPLVGSTVRIEMNFDTTIAKNPIFNVIGDVKGTRYPGDYIYFVAHRDSSYINPGAVDNAAGVATIMEMARTMARSAPQRTLRFIATDAEETGLLGATEYCKAHESEVQKHGLICINFDMNDVNLQRVRVLNLQCSNFSGEMRQVRAAFSQQYPAIASKYIINITKGGGGADGGPFMKRGTDGALAMGEWGSSWEYHTRWDNMQFVNKESWLVGGIILGSWGLRLANR
jgi:hypothetical protein